jgi:hypothetical protein
MRLADATAASNSMASFITPVVSSLVAIAAVAVVFFLVNGGIQLMTSAGNPERMEHAKNIIRNALLGLVVVIAAATLTAILSHAFVAAGPAAAEKLPAVVPTQPMSSNALANAVISATMGFLKSLIASSVKPFLDALTFFTQSTPLMTANSSVFNLWLIVVGITDALFVLIVTLLGFHMMSFATFGLEEIDFKHTLPKIGLAFLLVNTSIFAIDAIIALSNGMIAALNAGVASKSVWDTLEAVVNQPQTLGLAALLLMLAFVVMSVILMVYYVMRLVTLYVGAVLSPIIFVLWLLPGYKAFAETAVKAYLAVIFVLFINVVILDLAASIFGGMTFASPDHTLDPLMSMVVGIGALLALLKTQTVLMQLSYASAGATSMTRLGGQLSNVILSGGKGVMGRFGREVADIPSYVPKSNRPDAGDRDRTGDYGGPSPRRAPASQAPMPDYAKSASMAHEASTQTTTAAKSKAEAVS